MLDSSTPGFDEALAHHCKDLQATLAFDAVAGDAPGRLLRAMPRGGKVVVYGALSERSVEGFWLSSYLGSLSLPGLLYRALQVQRALTTDLQTKVRARYRLEDAVEGIRSYQERMTDGKVLLTP